MKLLAALILFSFSVYADEADDLAKKLETMPAAQRAEVLQIMMMKAQMNREDSRLTPELTITGQEGFKFKTQDPVVAENNASQVWNKYRNPSFPKPSLHLHSLMDRQRTVIQHLNNPESKYNFRFYTLNSEFIIKSFIHVGSDWMFILTDKNGVELLVDNEHDLRSMLEGNTSEYDMNNSIVLDWIANGKIRQSVKAETHILSGLNRFVEALKKGEDRSFSVFKDRKLPNPEPKTKGEWINYYLKGVLGKEAIISNEKGDQYSVNFDIEADTDVLLFLVYSDFIQPYAPKFTYNDAYDRHRLFQDQDESKLIQNVLYKQRKRTKEEQEEFLRIQEDIKKRKQQ